MSERAFHQKKSEKKRGLSNFLSTLQAVSDPVLPFFGRDETRIRPDTSPSIGAKKSFFKKLSAKSEVGETVELMLLL